MMTAPGDIGHRRRGGARRRLQLPHQAPQGAEAVALVLEQAAEHKRLVDHARALEQRLEQHEEQLGRSDRRPARMRERLPRGARRRARPPRPS